MELMSQKQQQRQGAPEGVLPDGAVKRGGVGLSRSLADVMDSSMEDAIRVDGDGEGSGEPRVAEGIEDRPWH